MRTILLQIIAAIVLVGGVAVVFNFAESDRAHGAPTETVPSAQSAPIDAARMRTSLPAAVYIDPAAYIPEPLCRVVHDSHEQVTLREVAEAVTKISGLPCRIREYDLQDTGNTSDDMVTFGGGVPLYRALDQMCFRKLWHGRFATPLAWYVEHGIVVITTGDATVDQLFVQGFDALPALRHWDGDWQGIIDVLLAHCDGEWMDLDGIGGEIDVAANALLIRQTFPGLRKCAALLEAMHQQAQTIYVDQPPADALLIATLEQPVNGVFQNVPLETAAASLEEQTGIPIELSNDALNDEGVSGDDLVVCNLKGQPLRVVLDAMLAEVAGNALDFFIQDGVLWITTSDEGVDRLSTILYNVEDLLQVMEAYQIEDLILKQTSGEWVDMDGVGGEVDLMPSGYLIVSNTRSSHESVRQMLAKLREVVRIPDADDPNAIVSRNYHLSATLAEDLAPALKKLVAPDSWHDQSQNGHTGRGQVYSLRLDAHHTSLIVRQTLENHRLIERLLDRVDPHGYGH